MEESYKSALSHLVGQIKTYNPKLDVDFLNRAYDFSYEAHRSQLRKSGEPYFQHCLEVARILANLRLDAATIASGLLHDAVEDTGTTLQEIEERFNAEVALLVEGVTGIHRLQAISAEEKAKENYLETYVKMLLSVVKDIRVILIKLADRLHNMRTLKHLSDKKQREIAIETREIYVPLANRLGLAKIKSELEDLVFKFLDNEEYKRLARKVNEKRQRREQDIHRLVATIQNNLSSYNISAKVEGRPKSLYSIYKKSQNRNLAFEDMYDLSAIRIIVETEQECYQANDLVQTTFEPCPDKFRDYIKMPKPNGYQSLHTVIRNEDDKLVEIQIRTAQMHQIAEDGIAAHWKYKEGKIEDSTLDKYLVDFRQWLRQLAEWLQDAKDEPEEVLSHFKIDLFKDEIFVYTPKGKLLKLPADSTPVDFAFAVHSDLGIHCLGAKVNGEMVPLNHKLKSGDTVEIIKSQHQKPDMEWINFVRTSKAYGKIKRWFKESMFEQCCKLGEAIIEQEFRRWGIKQDEVDLEALAGTWGLAGAPQLYHAVGVNRVTARQIFRKVSSENHQDQKTDVKDGLRTFLDRARHAAAGVLVEGLEDGQIQFGACCQPLPGDRILGLVTKTNDVIVHRSDCQTISRLIKNPEHFLDAQWEVEHNENFLVRLQTLGHDRKNFLRDLSAAIAQTQANIVSVYMNTKEAFIQGQVVVEIKNLLHLTQVIKKISKVNGVINVERLDGTGEPLAYLAGVPSRSWTNAN